MNKWIIYQTETESIDLVNQINICEGYPNGATTTYCDNPEVIRNKATLEFVGYGVPIFSAIYKCLTESQINSISVINNEDYIFGDYQESDM